MSCWQSRSGRRIIRCCEYFMARRWPVRLKDKRISKRIMIGISRWLGYRILMAFFFVFTLYSPCFHLVFCLYHQGVYVDGRLERSMRLLIGARIQLINTFVSFCCAVYCEESVFFFGAVLNFKTVVSFVSHQFWRLFSTLWHCPPLRGLVLTWQIHV